MSCINWTIFTAAYSNTTSDYRGESEYNVDEGSFTIKPELKLYVSLAVFGVLVAVFLCMLTFSKLSCRRCVSNFFKDIFRMLT